MTPGQAPGGLLPSWRRHPGRIAIAALAPAAAVMLAMGWRRWPDLLVDYGREVYTAWQLAEGAALYRDVAYFNGPLSPYFNALVFRVTGPGWIYLALVNIAVTALVAGLLWRLLSPRLGPLAAGAGTLVFLAVFAFGQYMGIGNYNFVTPYAHELVHGTVLALGALALVANAERGRRPTLRWFLAGLLGGAALLTKVEIVVGLGIALAAAVAGGRWALRLSFRAVATRVAAAGLGAAVVIVTAWAALATSLGGGAALAALSFPVAALFRGSVADSFFYRHISGLDAPLQNGLALVLTALGILAAVAVVALLARGIEATERRRPGLHLPAGLAAVAALVAAGLLLPVPWLRLGRALPLLTLAAFVFELRTLRRDQGTTPPREARLGVLLLLGFGLGMLAKQGLNARVAHYGFALAMPATVGLFALLVARLPRLARTPGASAAWARTLTLIVVALFAGHHVVRSAHLFARKNTPVGAGADTILAYDAEYAPRAEAVNGALAEVEARTAPTDTLCVIPEGIMVNYLARRRTPVRHVNYMPPEIAIFGEQHILDDLEKSPPRFVLVVDKRTAEYGVPWFGRDYARELWSFFAQGYEPVWQHGAPPLSGRGFGVLLAERRRNEKDE